MAERRMFAKTIIDSDAFLDMPLSAQALYFHLSMRADDDGFINNPKKLQRMIGGSDDDLKLLILKKFIIPFESGIVVIKHWKIHNYIQKDRYKETMYQEEKAMLNLKDNKAYTLSNTPCIQSVYNTDTQVRKGKERERLEIEEEEEETGETPDYTDPDNQLTVLKSSVWNTEIILSENQIADLLEKMGLENFEEYRYRLGKYIKDTGHFIKSHYETMLKWYNEDRAVG